jgi:DegV family protein with EDD domain
MSKIAIVCDSACDITSEIAKEFGIRVVETPIIIDGESFLLGDMDHTKFHQLIDSAKTFPTTSQPSALQFQEVYQELKEEGYDDILSIHVSHILSGTLNSAKMAKEMVDINIHLIDSLSVSAPQLTCLMYARKLVDAGIEVKEIVKRVEAYAVSTKAFFSVATLDNLVRGGRLTRPRYLLGKLLNFKPILVVKDGAISSYGKTRNLEKTRDKAYEISLENFQPDESFNYIMAHCEAKELADKYEKRIKSEYPNTTGIILNLGSVSIHAGKGCLVVFPYKLPEA